MQASHPFGDEKAIFGVVGPNRAPSQARGQVVQTDRSWQAVFMFRTSTEGFSRGRVRPGFPGPVTRQHPGGTRFGAADPLFGA